MRIPVLFLLASAVAAAQPITFGLKAGVPFIDPSGASGESRPFAGGGSVELRLPGGFAVEASALYRRIGLSYSYTVATGGDASPRYEMRMRGNSWEFPFVGKYYFRPRNRSWQPFLGTGWALRTIAYNYDGNISVLSGTPQAPTPSPFHVHDRSDLGVGATAVAGLRWRLAGRMWLTPEFRYTRWGLQQTTARRNDPVFFLGLTF